MQAWLEKTRQAKWPFWAGLVFFFWVVIGMVSLIDYIAEWLVDENKLPVKEIVVQGHQNYVLQQDVLQALEPQMQQSLFAVDVDGAAERLAALQWVYSVSVRKQWPNRLNVYLTEQEPAAHWNADFLLNTQGDVFQGEQARLKQPLAWLYGPEGDEKQALETYRAISELMALYALEIAELSLTERHALQISLTNGVRLQLGREDWLNRSKRFVENYHQLAQLHQLEYVDLRYDTGFALGLKPQQE